MEKDKNAVQELADFSAICLWICVESAQERWHLNACHALEELYVK